uniref:delta-60 repeat domain-containing protein n=1 Tax=Cronobacter dublinensis TaxID=413497 RepID=UPI0018F8822E
MDLTFDPGSAPDNIVYAVAHQPDGKVLIGGLFIRVNGTQRFRIARLNTDGSTDSTFQANVGTASVGPEVYALAVQPDGKVLVGGLFSTVNGVTRISVARLNTDGSLVTTFTS